MVVLLFGTILVGCAGDGKTSQEATPTPATTPSGDTSSKYPDYLNLESTWPVVKEGNDVTISFWTTQSEANGADYEENWYLQYLVDKSNLNIEFTQIMSDQITEQKNLLLNTGNIPDIMYGADFSSTELVKYGQEQGLLLRLNDYMNEELTPNMVAAFEKDPTAKTLITLPDGGIYSVPRIDSSLNEGGLSRHFFNTKWLEAIDRDIPTTLDELIEVLYLFKSEDPGAVGKENVVPIGSADAYWATILDYILNAYGFLSPGNGFSPCLRNGEVVFPAGTEVYLEYLKLMKQFFDDGIISPDYYTMDETTLTALIANGNTGLITEPALCFMTDGWEDWWAVKPLTSDQNPQQQWGSYYGYILGGFVISAETEHPEAIMRLADWFFTKQNAVYCRTGPYMDTEDTYGLFDTGWHIENDFDLVYGDLPSKELLSGKLFLPAHNESVGLTGNFWLSDGLKSKNILQEWAGNEIVKKEFDLQDADQHYRASVTENLMPYSVESLPAGFFFYNEQEAAEISDLATVLSTYAEAETAKFITGVRDMSEFDRYLSELESMGLSKYVDYYVKGWQNFKSNQGK